MQIEEPEVPQALDEPAPPEEIAATEETTAAEEVAVTEEVAATEAATAAEEVGAEPPLSEEEKEEQAARRIREAEEEATRVRRALAQVVVREKAGILLRQGYLQIEPSLGYSYSSRDRLDVAGLNIIDAIFIGVQDVEQVESESFSSSLGIRYGIFDDLQIGLTIPYQWTNEALFRPEGVERVPEPRDVKKTREGSGLGDINLALSYHFFPETRYLPDLVASLGFKTKTGTSPFEVKRDGLDVKIPTGSGHYGVRTGVSFTKASEPAILFGSAGYFFHLPEEDLFNVSSRTPFEEIDPGDTFSWSLGFAFSLNWNLSVSASFQHSIGGETEVARLIPVGRNLRKIKFTNPGSDSNSAMLSLGVTYALGGTTSLDLNVGIGLTRDAPDVTLRASLPYTLNANEYVRQMKLPRLWRN
jgi:hypothetical protein